VFKKIVFTLREKQSRSARTSFIIIDAQSVKNTDTAEHRGYDGGKRISGIKRHLAVDINGLPQAIHITTANVSDRNGASAMLALNSGHLQQVKSVLVDGGYTGSNFAADVYTNLNATVQVAKRNELHKFEVLHNAGSLNVPSVGWINVDDFGRTVSINSIQVVKWLS
jgi:transposase